MTALSFQLRDLDLSNTTISCLEGVCLFGGHLELMTLLPNQVALFSNAPTWIINLSYCEHSSM